jgi:hypothetical protein
MAVKQEKRTDDLPAWAVLYLDLCPSNRRLQTADDAKRWIGEAAKVIGKPVSEQDMEKAVARLPGLGSYTHGLLEICQIIRNNFRSEIPEHLRGGGYAP